MEKKMFCEIRPNKYDVKYIETKDIRYATQQEMADNWDGWEIGDDSPDDETDYYIVEYWDGNNMKKDIYDSFDVSSEFEAEIDESEEQPEPRWYFNYDLKIDDKIIRVYTSNTSGSVSPYYKTDEGE